MHFHNFFSSQLRMTYLQHFLNKDFYVVAFHVRSSRPTVHDFTWLVYKKILKIPSNITRKDTFGFIKFSFQVSVEIMCVMPVYFNLFRYQKFRLFTYSCKSFDSMMIVWLLVAKLITLYIQKLNKLLELLIQLTHVKQICHKDNLDP